MSLQSSPAELLVEGRPIQRLLISKLRFHGDVLLVLPLVNYLKDRFPDLEIDMLVYQESAALVQHHPAICYVHPIDRGWKQQAFWHQLGHEASLVKQLAQRNFDLFIHLTEDWRGVILQQCLRIPVSVTGDYARRKNSYWWRKSFSHHYIVQPEKRHMVDRQADALRSIGLKVASDELVLSCYAGPQDIETIEQRLENVSLRSLPFVQLHPGSRFFHKVWPAEKVAALCDRIATLGLPVLLTGSPDQREQAFAREVMALTKTTPINWVGQLSLLELAELTRRAICFIGVDSAPAHIAAAVNTPAVVIFGPTSSQVWRPWSQLTRVVTAGMECQPCSQKGCNNSGISECLTGLAVERVWQQAQVLLGDCQAVNWQQAKSPKPIY